MGVKMLMVFMVLFISYTSCEDDVHELFSHLHGDDFDVSPEERALNQQAAAIEKQIDSALANIEHNLNIDGNVQASNNEVIIAKNEVGTQKPLTRYEVTENVVDIPNPQQQFRPVISNYSTPRPLNNATIVNPNNNANVNESNKLKKNYISILHIKHEFDSKENHNDFHSHKHVLPGVADYIHGLHKGFAHGFHDARPHKDVDHSKHIVTAPVSFLSKLRRKSSDVFAKVKSIFRHKHGDDC